MKCLRFKIHVCKIWLRDESVTWILGPDKNVTMHLKLNILVLFPQNQSFFFRGKTTYFHYDPIKYLLIFSKRFQNFNMFIKHVRRKRKSFLHNIKIQFIISTGLRTNENAATGKWHIHLDKCESTWLNKIIKVLCVKFAFSTWHLQKRWQRWNNRIRLNT